jgi:S1-C subfamily serine protease
MNSPNTRGVSRSSVVFAITAVLLVGALAYTSIVMSGLQPPQSVQQLQKLVTQLQNENAQLQQELASKTRFSNLTVMGIDPVAIYQQDNRSVVTVEGTQVNQLGLASVLGSGFVVSFGGHYYIITNYHVVQSVVNATVTFWNGDSYPAKVVGTDPYSDLAVISTEAPSGEFHPLTVVSSSGLRVGEPVVAIGNPFGLSGSETFGIISQLGRTISESLAGNFPIADVIQFSAPINPGNSGGPLISANGTVIGITTAVVQSSQGVGFAIPSDTILRELPSLVATGSYNMHPYMGIESVDMNYQLAQLQGANVTYGVLIERVVTGGPAAIAGLRGGTRTVTVGTGQYIIGGDIIISMNGTRIVNTDALSTYLEEHALPGEKVVVGIIRNGQFMSVTLVLGTRPPPPS